MLLGFAIYGLASGPLAHTANVVLVESYPEAPNRIYTRATALDTVGALLGPLMVAATLWAGLNWRWLAVLFIPVWVVGSIVAASVQISDTCQGWPFVPERADPVLSAPDQAIKFKSTFAYVF